MLAWLIILFCWVLTIIPRKPDRAPRFPKPGFHENGSTLYHGSLTKTLDYRSPL